MWEDIGIKASIGEKLPVVVWFMWPQLRRVSINVLQASAKAVVTLKECDAVDWRRTLLRPIKAIACIFATISSSSALMASALNPNQVGEFCEAS